MRSTRLGSPSRPRSGKLGLRQDLSLAAFRHEIATRAAEPRYKSAVTGEHTRRFGHLAVPHLEPDEEIADIAPVVPVRGAHGVGSGVTRATGEALAQVGAVKGSASSVAGSFPRDLPQASTRLLCVTNRRLLFLLADPSRKKAELIWQVPIGQVRAVQHRPRLQLMARFRIHFADGSSVAVFTTRRRTIDSLAACLPT